MKVLLKGRDLMDAGPAQSVSCTFFVPGRAEPERKRQVPPRGAFRGARVDTPKARDYKARIALCARDAMGYRAPFDGPLRLEWVEYRQRTSTYRKSDRYPFRRPDCTNIQKLLEDAMTGIVWRDDAQVCEIVSQKRFVETDQAPGLQVHVRSLL